MEHFITPPMAESLIRESQVEAQKAIDEGNPPFGCVITDVYGRIVMRAHNTQNTDHDPTAHAEINALSRLGRELGNRSLKEYIMVANAESCSMCASAAVKAYVEVFFYGAPAEGRMNPQIHMSDIADATSMPLQITGGILAEECAAQIALGRQTEK